MTSLAQGKRSDTLGKPPPPITPRPARAKVNITRSVSVLLPLQGASNTAHYTQGVASLALGYELLPPRGVSVKTRPHRKVLRMRKNRSAICGRTFLNPHGHSTSNISHPTSNIQHFTFNIPHSQHSSPKSTRFFPLRPAPRPNTPFSACYCNRLTFSHLSSEDPRATFQTHHSPPRNAIFRPSIPALSRLHPLPFAPRSLSPRNPIHA